MRRAAVKQAVHTPDPSDCLSRLSLREQPAHNAHDKVPLVIPPGTNGEATKSEAASGMRLRFLLSSLVVRMVPPRSTKTKRGLE